MRVKVQLQYPLCRSPRTAYINKWYRGAALALLCSVLPAMATAQTPVLKKVKAAFVFNLAKFVSWPDAALAARPDQLLVCFYREDFLGSGFAQIEGKSVQGRLLQRTVIADLNAAGGCDIVLLRGADLAAFQTEQSQLPLLPLLTIADLTAAPDTGIGHRAVAMNLVRRGASISFEVNINGVTERDLGVSSELLKLADIVREAPPL
jgi:hypothetical protein